MDRWSIVPSLEELKRAFDVAQARYDYSRRRMLHHEHPDLDHAEPGKNDLLSTVGAIALSRLTREPWDQQIDNLTVRPLVGPWYVRTRDFPEPHLCLTVSKLPPDAAVVVLMHVDTNTHLVTAKGWIHVFEVRQEHAKYVAEAKTFLRYHAGRYAVPRADLHPMDDLPGLKPPPTAPPVLIFP